MTDEPVDWRHATYRLFWLLASVALVAALAGAALWLRDHPPLDRTPPPTTIGNLPYRADDLPHPTTTPEEQ